MDTKCCKTQGIWTWRKIHGDRKCHKGYRNSKMLVFKTNKNSGTAMDDVTLFLHLLVSFFFLFLFFHPVLAWRSQKLSIAIVAKHVFFLFGYVWKWGDLFSLQRNHFGVKKGHFMLRHTHLLILFWTCVFVASMLCWFAPSKTYPTEIYRFTLAQKASL